MRTMSFRELERQIDARRTELEISDSDAAPVNSGRFRTPEKRALLSRLQAIASEKGTRSRFQANF
jgi:hypothetical protein